MRVLKACRKTAVAARRVALQMIHNTVVWVPDEPRDTLRKLTRMELIRTLAAWRPDMTDYRNVASAYRIASASRSPISELHDEIADLDAMIAAIVDELAPGPGDTEFPSVTRPPRSSSSPPATTPSACIPKQASLHSAA